MQCVRNALRGADIFSVLHSRPMRALVLILLFAFPLAAETKVTLLHFSDYHSHALPFYTEEGERGGLARAIAYLEREKRSGALVFSGGDTINKGSPAWSDKYGCAEWSWLNGIVDAMAFGNHDADYGLEAFEKCRERVRYPILSANTAGFPPYRVFERDGIRIGVFAIAGSDFAKLVRVEGLTFGDPVAAAQRSVRELRDRHRADAVVMIGHQHAEADYELARAVPGIDVIFGTHSHLKRALTRIPGTSTWFISPSQYLSHISRVELTFDGRKLTSVDGELVPVTAEMGENRKIARRVGRMQQMLERDPDYSALFVPIGTLREPLSVSALAQLTLGAMRAAGDADVALSTASSFRHALPAGAITPEQLRAALPYDNQIVVCTLTGAQLTGVINESARRAGGDSTLHVAPPGPFDSDRSYRVATTDYVADVSYRDVFACAERATAGRVRAEVEGRLADER